MTRNPVMSAGLKQRIVTIVLDNGINAIRINVTNTPPPNKYKSKGLNNPKINCPLFVFAGIK
jgi:arabinogalactan endo-1,4-beta-galactosidase